MYRQKKQIYVNSLKEINEHIKYCRKNRILAPSEDWVKLQNLKRCYYTMEVLLTRFIIRYEGNGNRYAEYIFYLDGTIVEEKMSGVRAFNLLQRMSNKAVNDLTENLDYFDLTYDKWKLDTIGGLVWFNPKYSGMRFEHCYEYDENSSYSYAMLQPIPNTKVVPRYGFLKKGEIGFRTTRRGYSDDECFYAVFKEGELAEYIYPAIESPFKKFVEYYYTKRQKAKTKAEKDKIKEILNYSIGYIRRKDPFLHSCILSRARYYIESFIDDDTLYSNTDAIVSKVRRPDLEQLLGDGIGQFKIAHEGNFAYNGSGYQWNNELPSVRGKSKNWFKNAFPNGFDILTDELPFTEANIFYFDEQEGVIKSVKG